MRLLKSSVAAVILLCLSVAVFAHSGGTDSKGGHTNHSTGEYHYHHGYSAHQHRDIDGDGDLDCPYKSSSKTKSSAQKYDSYKKSINFTEDVKDVLKVIVIWLLLVAGCRFLVWLYKKIFKR